MIKWLEDRHIAFNHKHTKAELYEIIKFRKDGEKQFKVDSLFSEHGHTVLRLPPYHPELNPIEKA